MFVLSSELLNMPNCLKYSLHYHQICRLASGGKILNAFFSPLFSFRSAAIATHMAGEDPGGGALGAQDPPPPL